MPLGMEIGLSPGYIVLYGDLPIPKKGAQPAVFGPCYCDQMAGWIKMPLGIKVGLSPSHIVLDGDPALRRKK